MLLPPCAGRETFLASLITKCSLQPAQPGNLTRVHRKLGSPSNSPAYREYRKPVASPIYIAKLVALPDQGTQYLLWPDSVPHTESWVQFCCPYRAGLLIHSPIDNRI